MFTLRTEVMKLYVLPTDFISLFYMDFRKKQPLITCTKLTYWFL